MAFLNHGATGLLGYNYISPEKLPPGKDEYWIRNTQSVPNKNWRGLESRELEILIANNNSCSNWDDLLVSDPFDPGLIRNTAFYGLVRIGAMRNFMLRHHDFCLPAGIRNSTIISCDIGDDVAIQDCAYISHYIIGDDCILFRVDEMQATNHAKFGNGAIKDGEDEKIRIWIDVMNEAGGRSILPFREMLCADAFLWAAYRDDTGLMDALKNITQREYGGVRGAYGIVGSNTIIKSTRVIKDACIGEYTYIKGANKLKNITVLSSKEEPSQIGEGVELVNGIMGYGCQAFYGVKAVRFIMGRCSSLKYGARLIHSVLGDNSTVSCCEILNNLIFPVHEQHHNNSFLIASLVQGMSNMAAGATVGSNHNSRANDGEIRAGRGFWPGLSATLKHSSIFGSFILISKGDYPYELNIKFPFSLVNNNLGLDRLEVMPAYFWMYNLYSLERNSWKTIARDKRKIKKQHIEPNYLAPDTVEEIISSVTAIENLLINAGITDIGACKEDFSQPSKNDQIEDHPIISSNMERHNRDQVLLRPRHARAAYREMLHYYAINTLTEYLENMPELSYRDFINDLNTGTGRITEWVNLGGQIAPAFRIDELRRRIRHGEIDSWEAIHSSYDEMAASYAKDKARHAWEVFRVLGNPEAQTASNTDHPLMNIECFRKELNTLIKINQFIAEQVFRTRAKDYTDPFRTMTYRNADEMKQVIGTPEDNSFVKLIRKRTEMREESINMMLDRL